MEPRLAVHIDDLIRRYPVLEAARGSIEDAYLLLEDTYAHGGKLLIAGNGGSAADAEHIAGELMKRFKTPRPVSPELADKLRSVDPDRGAKLDRNLECSLMAIPLVAHEALSTAYINDVDGYGVFAQQLFGYGRPGDVFLGISTSGNSENILNAAVVAKALGIRIISLTGQTGGKLAPMADVAIRAPETETYLIQELHLPIYHCLCLMLEERFWGGKTMRIALVGSSGYISGYLIEAFSKDSSIEQILKIDQDNSADVKLDLQNADEFDYNTLNGFDIVVFTAAISSPDRCAREFDLCWKINVSGTIRFIREALDRGCKVLFFSSDAVFGDIPGEIYTEVSETKSVTPYGRMKKTVEDEFREEVGFKAIRLSYVVSRKDRFVSYCLKCIDSGEIADVFHPFYRNCVTVTDVVNTAIWMLKNWDRYTPHILNVAGPELVSRVRIADEINRHMGGRLKYTISTPDSGFYANRPAITQMQSLYLEEYGIMSNTSFTYKIKTEVE